MSQNKHSPAAVNPICCCAHACISQTDPQFAPLYTPLMCNVQLPQSQSSVLHYALIGSLLTSLLAWQHALHVHRTAHSTE